MPSPTIPDAPAAFYPGAKLNGRYAFLQSQQQSCMEIPATPHAGAEVPCSLASCVLRPMIAPPINILVIPPHPPKKCSDSILWLLFRFCHVTRTLYAYVCVLAADNLQLSRQCRWRATSGHVHGVVNPVQVPGQQLRRQQQRRRPRQPSPWPRCPSPALYHFKFDARCRTPVAARLHTSAQ